MQGALSRLFRGRGAGDGEGEEETTHSLTWTAPDRNGSAPSVRNGHTANLIDSKIFVFGGGEKADLLGDLYIFDVRDHHWTQPPCTGVPPPPRSRHASANVGCNLYIWGGIGGGLDVHKLDTLTMDWSTPPVKGALPDSRFGHTCTAIDGAVAPRLCMLGGHNSRQALSDLHVLDVSGEDLAWSRPSVLGEAPVCGNRHATVLLDDVARPQEACLRVFAADMHDTFGTLYALLFRDGPSGNGWRWMPQLTAGKAPLSRARPSLVLLDESVFILCGVAAGKPLASVCMLNTRTYAWSTPTLDGVPPPARMGASATRVGTDIYVFGGSDGKVSLRDLHVLVYVTWFNPSYSGHSPYVHVHAAHAMCTCTSRGSLCMFCCALSSSVHICILSLQAIRPSCPAANLHPCMPRPRSNPATLLQTTLLGSSRPSHSCRPPPSPQPPPSHPNPSPSPCNPLPESR